MSELNLGFDHGLGDCCHFAAMLQLYRRRGYEIGVHYQPNKAAIFKAAGVHYLPVDHVSDHPWQYPPDFGQLTFDPPWAGNKVFGNINRQPLPPIGDEHELWEELRNVSLPLKAVVSEADRAEADRFLSGLPRPVILVHTHGNNWKDRKNLSDETTLELYIRLLDDTRGSVVLLDWDQRVPKLSHARVRHIGDDWERISLEKLWSLIDQSDLFIGVDSGPYHFASFTDVPVVGVWHRHHPWQCTMPRALTANLVSASRREYAASRRRDWNILEYAGAEPTAAEIATVAERMLGCPHYLAHRENIARDVQLQQFIDWCQATTSLSAHADRHTSFDVLLRAVKQRFQDATIVETGCIRAAEDWSAGYSTYLFAVYLTRRKAGRLHSFDNEPEHLRLAETLIAPFGERVQFHQGDSVECLSRFSGTIDVLYLDSLDVEDPRHAEHTLREVKAAESKLHARSLVLIDDTGWQRGWVGKGALAVPWLLDKPAPPQRLPFQSAASSPYEAIHDG
jgi:hypothetical protein